MTAVHLIRHAAVTDSFTGICFGQRVDPPIVTPQEPGVARLRSAVPRGSTVVSSPARRAQETAILLAANFAIDDRWSERDFGAWEGRRWADCWPDVPAAHLESADSYVAYTPDGAEKHTDVLARVGAALDDAALSDTDLVAITHAGPIRAALIAAGVPATAAYALVLPNLSATSLALTSNGWAWCADGRNL